MENTINITEARVYVGTYRKYNSGSIDGNWLDLNDYTNKTEFYQACRELHSDKKDQEYMFQDYENIPSALISESWISDQVFEIIQAVEDLDRERQEAFWIWCNNGHHSLHNEDIEDLISAFDDEYIGCYESEEDFARELVEEREDINDFVLKYFDYEAYARDLFLSDYWSEGRHVFYNR